MLDIEFDAIVNQITNQPTIQVCGRGFDFFTIIGNSDDGSVLNGGFTDALGFDFIEKIRIRDRRGAAGDAAIVKLFKNSKQHEGNHNPNGCLRKHIIHERSLNRTRY